MKTFVIQLETHDDIISARDKISWNKSPRVLLVWPPEGSVLSTRLDLILLQRACRQMGAQMGVVSNHRDVQYQARDLRIPAFLSTDEAQVTNWRRARGRKGGTWKIRREPRNISDLREKAIVVNEKPINSPLIRWSAFLTGIIAFISIFLIFLPGAKITIPSSTIEQEMILPVWSSPEIQQTSISGGVPSQLKSIIVEGRGQKPTSGSINVADTRAIGTIRFTNLTEKAITVPAGTIISTGGVTPIRFSTTREIQIEGGLGKFNETSATAVIAGASGNIAPRSIEAVEGVIGLQVAATNILAFQGGSDRLMPAPGEKDIEQLRDQLRADLQKTALSELMSKPDQSVLMIFASLKEKQIVEETLEPPPGQPGETLIMILRIEFEIWTVSLSDLDSISKIALDTNLPAGYQPIMESLSVHTYSEPQMDGLGFARWSLKTKRTLKKAVPYENLVDWVVGKPVKDASIIIQTNLGVESAPQIDCFPSWWWRMPILPFRINVELK